jgi:hypothetical protein
MLAERSVWLINLQRDPDGRFALHLALQEASTARIEYMRVLKIFMKLIPYGTLPGGRLVSYSFSLPPFWPLPMGIVHACRLAEFLAWPVPVEPQGN